MSKKNQPAPKKGGLSFGVIVAMIVVIGLPLLVRGMNNNKKQQIANQPCNETTAGTQRYVDGCYQTCDGNGQRVARNDCKKDGATQVVNCNLYYANSKLSGPSQITQIKRDGAREPRSTAAVYRADTHTDNSCTFTCVDGYERDEDTKVCKIIDRCAEITALGCDKPDITISDGTTSITIMACNLGSNIAGTGSESYGCHYQRGNNYGFDGTLKTLPTSETSSSPVDASSYGPSKPYSSNIFIKQGRRDSSDNRNLRGGTGDTTTTNGVGTHADRQGPCPDGYHVPSTLERKQLVTLVGGNGATLRDTLFLPFAGDRIYASASLSNRGRYGGYWSSSPCSSVSYAYSLLFHTSPVYPQNGNDRGYGYSVRCFKNS